MEKKRFERIESINKGGGRRRKLRLSALLRKRLARQGSGLHGCLPATQLPAVHPLQLLLPPADPHASWTMLGADADATLAMPLPIGLAQGRAAVQSRAAGRRCPHARQSACRPSIQPACPSRIKRAQAPRPRFSPAPPAILCARR